MKTLKRAKNPNGHLSPVAEREIKKFLSNPTPENWDSVAMLMITPEFKTIWEAVMEMDSSFPREGRTYDENGQVVSEWPKIPTALEVVRAIKKITAP